MILIALGANLPSRYGTPYQTLIAAKSALSERGVEILAHSRTWLTAPVPISDQPWFHNEVISVKTQLKPFLLLDVLQDIENEFGRVRTVRNAARLLDLDLIAYNQDILDKPELIVPHPRMSERAFVILPMKDIVSGNWIHPVSGMSLDDLIMHLPKGQKAEPMDENKAVA